jgi:hypothetical protein
MNLFSIRRSETARVWGLLAGRRVGPDAWQLCGGAVINYRF